MPRIIKPSITQIETFKVKFSSHPKTLSLSLSLSLERVFHTPVASVQLNFSAIASCSAPVNEVISNPVVDRRKGETPLRTVAGASKQKRKKRRASERKRVKNERKKEGGGGGKKKC